MRQVNRLFWWLHNYNYNDIRTKWLYICCNSLVLLGLSLDSWGTNKRECWGDQAVFVTTTNESWFVCAPSTIQCHCFKFDLMRYQTNPTLTHLMPLHALTHSICINSLYFYTLLCSYSVIGTYPTIPQR